MDQRWIGSWAVSGPAGSVGLAGLAAGLADRRMSGR